MLQVPDVLLRAASSIGQFLLRPLSRFAQKANGGTEIRIAFHPVHN